MATSTNGLGDMPQRDAGPAGPADLVGQDQSSSQSKQPDQEQQNRNFTSNVRNLHKSLDDTARQYPDMADACGKCKKLLTDAMVKRMASQSRQSGNDLAPPIAA
jgi:hypothetical protein